MVNGKIFLEKTTDNTTVEIAATGETTLYLLATLITDICESTNIPMDYFLNRLSISCKAMEVAKSISKNEA